MKYKFKTIGFNLLFNSLGGSREQIKELLKNIKLYKDYKIIIISSKNNEVFIKNISSGNVKVIYINLISNNVIIRVLFEQFILPFICIFLKIDLLFCPGNLSPVFLTKKKIQWIGTVGPFEKEFYKNINLYKKLKYLTNKFLIICSAKTSNYVIFESHYTKNLFINKYSIDINKCKVISIGKKNEYNKVNKIIHDSEIFIACVSHIYAYKNIEVLIEAVNILIKENYKFKVYVAGSVEDKRYFEKIHKLIKEYNIDNIFVFLGEVDKDKILNLYINCICLVNTSPIENFAYTLVEAMSCGTPIISTNTTAMPETCKNAALYFSPNDISKLTTNLKKIIESKKLRNKLSTFAIQRANEIYDYEVSNRKTIDLFKKTIG